MTSLIAQIRLRGPLVGLLLGLLTFFVLFDARQVNPSYLDWQLNGDAGQHHIGWEFFRHEPWHFPLGRIAGFGTPDGTSIVFTDSIPILALVFKVVRELLPDRFQYTGMWLLGCYALQGFFGWMLATLVTSRMYPKVLMTFFFLLSPILIDRHLQEHHALAAHWLILAAIYLSVQTERQFESRHPKLSWWICWGTLVVLSGVIHLYIAAMIVALYLASSSSNLRASRLGPWRGIVAIALTLGTFLLALYLCGAFIISSEHWADHSIVGFGRYSMNLLSPLSPGYSSNSHDAEHLSWFLRPHHDYTDGQYEGFNYLGLGVLSIVVMLGVGSVVAAVRFVRGQCFAVAAERELSLNLPVTITLVSLAVFALSHRIAMGSHLIVAVPLSDEILRRLEAFRSTGRFFWPCYYAIFLLSFRGLSAVTRARYAAFPILLHAALTVQAVDLSLLMHRAAKGNREAKVYKRELTATAWPGVIRQYENVKYYPPGDNRLYVPLGLLAAPLRVGINVAYKARSNPETLKQSEVQVKRELETGELAPRTLYVFKDDRLFDGLKSNPRRDEFLLRKLDGYHVAARLAVPAAALP